MAYRQVQLLAVVAAVACLAPLASATTYMVGGVLGWRAKFNQTGWADGKTFVVGGSLMFMYPKENHTVAQVGKDDFAACNLQGNFLGLWDSGNDVVTLDKPGKAWFICTKPNHCAGGMKLVIDVQVGGTTAPVPSPWFPGVPATPRIPGPQAPAPVLPAAPPSAAVRNPVGGAAAVAAAAAMIAAALAF